AGERVLVTGSTSGIGKHVAIMCAREGARVVVHGRDATRGAAVVETIAAAGGAAGVVAADGGAGAAWSRPGRTGGGRSGGPHRAGEQRRRRQRRSEPRRRIRHGSLGAGAAREPHGRRLALPRRHPAHAGGGTRLDRERVLTAGGAREHGSGAVHREQGW